MKHILIAILVLLVAVNASAYLIEEKVGDDVLCSYDVADLALVNDAAGRDIYVDGVLLKQFNPRNVTNRLISEVMPTNPTLMQFDYMVDKAMRYNDPEAYTSLQAVLVAGGVPVDVVAQIMTILTEEGADLGA